MFAVSFHLMEPFFTKLFFQDAIALCPQSERKLWSSKLVNSCVILMGRLLPIKLHEVVFGPRYLFVEAAHQKARLASERNRQGSYQIQKREEGESALPRRLWAKLYTLGHDAHSSVKDNRNREHN